MSKVADKKEQERWGFSSYKAENEWRFRFGHSSSPLDLFRIKYSWKDLGLWLFQVSIGQEEAQVLFSIAGFGKSLHLAFNHLPIPKLLTHYKVPFTYVKSSQEYYWQARGLTTGVIVSANPPTVFDEWYVRLELLHCSDSTWGNEKCFNGPFIMWNPVQLLFGELNSNSFLVTKCEAEVKLPERTYPVFVEVERITLSRPRYWKKQSFYRASIEVIDTTAPIPTGGEKFGIPRGRYSASCPLNYPNDSFCPEEVTDELLQQLALDKFRNDIKKERVKRGY